MSNRCHQNEAHAAGDRKACRHTLITANISIAASQQLTETNIRFLHRTLTYSPTQGLTPGWIHFRSTKFKSFGHVENCWLLLENSPPL